MLQKNTFILKNKSVLSLKLLSSINFMRSRNDCCCLAGLASGNDLEEHSLGLIRW